MKALMRKARAGLFRYLLCPVYLGRAVCLLCKQYWAKQAPVSGFVLRASFWSLLAAASALHWLVGGPRLVLSGHENIVTSLAFSRDGRFLASGSWDRTIKIWNPVTGENLKTLSFIEPSPVASLAFSSDGKLLALGGWNKVTLMNVVDGKESATLGRSRERGGTVIHVVLFSPDGKTLITADMNSLRAWDIETARLRSALLDETKDFFQAEAVAMSRDGKLLASGNNRGVVTLWDMDHERKQHSFPAHGDKATVSALAFAPDDRILATAGQDARTVLWQLSPTGGMPKEILTLKADTGGINSIAFSPDGKLLATAAYHVRVWNVATGKLLLMIEGRRVRFGRVIFSPDGETLAAGADDGIVELWDMRKRTKRLTPQS